MKHVNTGLVMTASLLLMCSCGQASPTSSLLESEETALSAEPLATKTVYVNWTEDKQVMEMCLNQEKVLDRNDQHFPVFKLATREELDRFAETFDGILSLDQAYGEFPSFIEATAGYDEAFFASHSLLKAYVTAGSGLLCFAMADIKLNDTLACLEITQLNHPMTYTSDMAGWLLMAEIPHIGDEVECDALMMASEAK